MPERRSIRGWLTVPALLLLCAAATLPALARVRVGEAVVIDGTPLFRTHHRELYVVPSPGEPARRIGRLPRRASALVADETGAWAVTTGRLRPERVRLFHVLRGTQRVTAFRPARFTIRGRVTIDGVAGSDARFVYLLPDGRYDRRTRRLEAGHLDHDPGLQVLRTLHRGAETWYLTRQREPSPDGAHAVRILHTRDHRHWATANAGKTRSTIRLEADPDNLFLFYGDGRILRFDRRTLRLAEDLSPMARPGTVELFAADAGSYWIVTRDDTPGGERTLWQVERDVLDGGPFHAGTVPAAFVPVAVDGEHVWFGAARRGQREPLIAVAKIDGTAQSYTMVGPHERRWQRFWRGTGRVIVWAPVVAVGAAVVVVTAPIWIPIVLTQE